MSQPTTLQPLPGSTGIPILGESLQFIRDPFVFLQTRIRRYGQVFQTKLFNCITIFSCSYQATLQLLSNQLPSSLTSQSTSTFQANTAYSEFLGPLYPKPNLMLSPDNSPLRTQSFQLIHLALEKNLHLYSIHVNHIIAQNIKSVTQHNEKQINLFHPYQLFKRIAEDALTTLLLGSMQNQQIRYIRKLCSDHFNGVVAVPFEFKVFGTQNARSKGIDAYDQLVKQIEQSLDTAYQHHKQGNPPSNVIQVLAAHLDTVDQNSRKQTQDLIVQLVLLLLSPAIAKSISGTLTCAVYSLCTQKHANNNFANELYHSLQHSNEFTDYSKIDMLIMETLRMYPPLPGGMRKVHGNTVVNGSRVEDQSRIWYSLIHCNRDETIYGEDAQSFNPYRWIVPKASTTKCPFAVPSSPFDKHEDVPTPLTFGAGDRHCKGRDVAWMIMRESLRQILTNHKIIDPRVTGKRTNVPAWDQNMRHLPILRPNDDSQLGLVRVLK